MTTSVVLLNDTTGSLNVIGEPLQVSQFGLGNFFTIAIYTNNFTGHVYLDGSLASHPKEDDWFEINLNDNVPYIAYPKDPNHPTGFPGLTQVGGYEDTNVPAPIGDTGIDSFTFQGNFIWLRARVYRGFINPVPNMLLDIQYYGSVRKIILGY